MPEQPFAVMPTWFLLASLCALTIIVGIVVAVISAYLIARRNAASPREIELLREENARLREEFERLKQGKAASGSTDFKAD